MRWRTRRLRSNTQCYVLNFIRRIVLSIATRSRVSDTFQRDRAKACNVLALSQSVKTVDGVRRLECDVNISLGHSGVEVASHRMLHRTTAQANLRIAVASYRQRLVTGCRERAPRRRPLIHSADATDTKYIRRQQRDERFGEAIANSDQLDLDRLVANMDRDSAPEPARHREGRTPGDRAILGKDTLDRAARTDLSNALAAVRSLAASRNRALRSAKSVGTLRVARHSLRGPLAAQHHMGERQRAGVELSRYCTAETPLGPE